MRSTGRWSPKTAGTLISPDVPKSDYGPFGVVDYCCYISSIEPGHRRIRTGLWTLGCRGYNVKLLKIHGSLNWLQCANCQQLFVGFEKYYLRQLGRESSVSPMPQDNDQTATLRKFFGDANTS